MRTFQPSQGRLARARRIWKAGGWRALAARAAGRAAAVLRALWHRLAQHRNYVFVHDRSLPAVGRPAGFSVEAIRGPAELSPACRRELLSLFGPQSLETDLWEVRHGAVLWLARIDGRLCGASLSRRGRWFRTWFVPLNPEDLVIFRNRTAPEFRGRGLCPALMNWIIDHEQAGTDARGYVDCRIYNRASIRSIEKAGFRRIATMKPLRRKDALGV